MFNRNCRLQEANSQPLKNLRFFPPENSIPPSHLFGSTWLFNFYQNIPPSKLIRVYTLTRVPKGVGTLKY